MNSKTLPTIYFKLTCSMALWGGTWIAGRMLAGSMHPMNAAAIRFSLASVMLIFLCSKKEGHLPRLTLKELIPVMFLGATGVLFYSYFFFTGLQTVPAGRAALIVACIPVCISAVSALLFKERFGGIRIFATLLSLAGVAVVIADGNPLSLIQEPPSRGDLLILGCVLSWTAYSLGGRFVMQTMPSLRAVTWSSIFGTVFILPLAIRQNLFTQIIQAEPLQWACLFYLGILATALAYYWYYDSIQVIGTSRSGIFINLVPVFAILLSSLLLGEAIHFSLVSGGLMVIAGVWLNSRS